MPRKKSTKSTPKPVEEKVVQPVEESQAKKDFRKFIETYKESNPKKYALKEQALQTKLNNL